jgi:hypothetical protein
MKVSHRWLRYDGPLTLRISVRAIFRVKDSHRNVFNTKKPYINKVADQLAQSAEEIPSSPRFCGLLDHNTLFIGKC